MITSTIAFVIFLLYFGVLAHLGLRRERLPGGRGGLGGRRGGRGGAGEHGRIYITYFGDP